MHAIANRTEGLNPAHKYVPWIVVDGVHTEEVKQKMLICENIKKAGGAKSHG